MKHFKGFKRGGIVIMATAISLIVSSMLYVFVRNMADAEARIRFDYRTRLAQLAVETRVSDYADILYGLRALFRASETVTRLEFHRYVSSLNWKKFEGIQNLNYSLHVSAADKTKFERNVQQDRSLNPDGYPKFAVRPSGKRASYNVLTYLEPLQGFESSFGLDIAASAPAEAALVAARDSGKLLSSGLLIARDGNSRVGLAMRLPVYRNNMPQDTIQDRRASYLGSVGVGFNVQKLMTGVLDDLTLRHLRFQLFDTGIVDASRTTSSTVRTHNLLFDTRQNMPETLSSADFFSTRMTMEFGGRLWESRFSAKKSDMLRDLDQELPWLAFGAGMLSCTLLFGILYSLASSRRRAVEIAQIMTKGREESETSLALAQQMAHLGNWQLDATLDSMIWSNETYRIFGFAPQEVRATYAEFMSRIHEQDRAAIRNAIARAMQNNEEIDTEHRIVRKDGAICWVQTIARPDKNTADETLSGTIMDITKRKLTEEALRKSQELLRQLAAHQATAKEDERKRIARDIHDELGQNLLALKTDISTIHIRTATAHPRLNKRVQIVLQNIDATIRSVKAIINDLRPSTLELGLYAATEWQIQQFQRISGINCQLLTNEWEYECELNSEQTAAAFRILQESLSNIARHSQATAVKIALTCDHQSFAMRVSDNGKGIQLTERRKKNAFGLLGIEERVFSLGGSLVVDSSPGNGTTLTITIPIIAPAYESDT